MLRKKNKVVYACARLLGTSLLNPVLDKKSFANRHVQTSHCNPSKLTHIYSNLVKAARYPYENNVILNNQYVFNFGYIIFLSG